MSNNIGLILWLNGDLLSLFALLVILEKIGGL